MALIKTLEKLFFRLIFSVAVPAAIIVLCLYIFHSVADIKYLPASGLAFGIGFYILYLTFKYLIKPDPKGEVVERPYKQFRYFAIVFAINLVINIEIVYLLVSHAGVPIFTAQTVAAVVVAYESYYAYQSLLYRETKRAIVRLPRKLADEIVYYDESGEEI